MNSKNICTRIEGPIEGGYSEASLLEEHVEVFVYDSEYNNIEYYIGFYEDDVSKFLKAEDLKKIWYCSNCHNFYIDTTLKNEHCSKCGESVKKLSVLYNCTPLTKISFKLNENIKSIYIKPESDYVNIYETIKNLANLYKQQNLYYETENDNLKLVLLQSENNDRYNLLTKDVIVKFIGNKISCHGEVWYDTEEIVNGNQLRVYKYKINELPTLELLLQNLQDKEKAYVLMWLLEKADYINEAKNLLFDITKYIKRFDNNAHYECKDKYSFLKAGFKSWVEKFKRNK